MDDNLLIVVVVAIIVLVIFIGVVIYLAWKKKKGILFKGSAVRNFRMPQPINNNILNALNNAYNHFRGIGLPMGIGLPATNIITRAVDPNRQQLENDLGVIATAAGTRFTHNNNLRTATLISEYYDILNAAIASYRPQQLIPIGQINPIQQINPLPLQFQTIDFTVAGSSRYNPARRNIGVYECIVLSFIHMTYKTNRNGAANAGLLGGFPNHANYNNAIARVNANVTGGNLGTLTALLEAFKQFDFTDPVMPGAAANRFMITQAYANPPAAFSARIHATERYLNHLMELAANGGLARNLKNNRNDINRLGRRAGYTRPGAFLTRYDPRCRDVETDFTVLANDIVNAISYIGAAVCNLDHLIIEALTWLYFKLTNYTNYANYTLQPVTYANIGALEINTQHYRDTFKQGTGNCAALFPLIGRPLNGHAPIALAAAPAAPAGAAFAAPAVGLPAPPGAQAPAVPAAAPAGAPIPVPAAPPLPARVNVPLPANVPVPVPAPVARGNIGPLQIGPNNANNLTYTHSYYANKYTFTCGNAINNGADALLRMHRNNADGCKRVIILRLTKTRQYTDNRNAEFLIPSRGNGVQSAPLIRTDAANPANVDAMQTDWINNNGQYDSPAGAAPHVRQLVHSRSAPQNLNLSQNVQYGASDINIAVAKIHYNYMSSDIWAFQVPAANQQAFEQKQNQPYPMVGAMIADSNNVRLIDGRKAQFKIASAHTPLMLINGNNTIGFTEFEFLPYPIKRAIVNANPVNGGQASDWYPAANVPGVEFYYFIVDEDYSISTQLILSKWANHAQTAFDMIYKHPNMIFYDLPNAYNDQGARVANHPVNMVQI